MIGLLIRRVLNPVLRLLSTVDDYLSWLLVFLPVLSACCWSGETIGGYGTLLALHILSVELLMICCLSQADAHASRVRGAWGHGIDSPVKGRDMTGRGAPPAKSPPSPRTVQTLYRSPRPGILSRTSVQPPPWHWNPACMRALREACRTTADRHPRYTPS